MSWRRMGFKVVLALMAVDFSPGLHAQEPGFRLEGMISRCLPVTGRKMTNVIFPVDIAAGVRVSRDVLVQKVKGVENVIEIKALRREFAPTNLAVYGKDGRLYSFVLHYVEDTAVLDYWVVADKGKGESKIRLTGWPSEPERLRVDAGRLEQVRGFLHRRASGDGFRLGLKGVFLRDSLLWLAFEVQNRAPMDCLVDEPRIYTEDRKRISRTATQELDVLPVYVEGAGVLPGFGRRVMVVGLRPFMVARGKRLVIAVSDATGEWQVVMRVGRRCLIRARKYSNDDRRFAEDLIATYPSLVKGMNEEK